MMGLVPYFFGSIVFIFSTAPATGVHIGEDKSFQEAAKYTSSAAKSKSSSDASSALATVEDRDSSPDGVKSPLCDSLDAILGKVSQTAMKWQKEKKAGEREEEEDEEDTQNMQTQELQADIQDVMDTNGLPNIHLMVSPLVKSVLTQVDEAVDHTKMTMQFQRKLDDFVKKHEAGEEDVHEGDKQSKTAFQELEKATREVATIGKQVKAAANEAKKAKDRAALSKAKATNLMQKAKDAADTNLAKQLKKAKDTKAFALEAIDSAKNKKAVHAVKAAMEQQEGAVVATANFKKDLETVKAEAPNATTPVSPAVPLYQQEYAAQLKGENIDATRMKVFEKMSKWEAAEKNKDLNEQDLTADGGAPDSSQNDESMFEDELPSNQPDPPISGSQDESAEGTEGTEPVPEAVDENPLLQKDKLTSDDFAPTANEPR